VNSDYQITGYILDNQESIPSMKIYFHFYYHTQTTYGISLASHKVGTGGSFLVSQAAAV